MGQRLRGGVVVEPLDHHLHIALASCVNVDCALDSVVQNTSWVIAIAAVVLAPCVPALFCAGFATTLGVPFETYATRWMQTNIQWLNGGNGVIASGMKAGE